MMNNDEFSCAAESDSLNHSRKSTDYAGKTQGDNCNDMLYIMVFRQTLPVRRSRERSFTERSSAVPMVIATETTALAW